MWQERGRQWIEAVQEEYPDIQLQFFFSWGDEYRVWPNYQNLVPFMNGVLKGIRHPARIVHAFESTFWNGYPLVVEYHTATRRVSGSLVDRSSHAEVCRATETLPATVGPFVVDEAGVAQREQAFAATAAGSYRFRLEGFQLHPPQPAAADD